MRKRTCWTRNCLLILTFTMFFGICEARADVNDLIASLNALEDHITGVAPLDAAQIAAHKATIDSNSQYMGDNATVIQASIDLVEAYDTTPGFGPLWININPPSRDSLSDDLVSTMYWVQQYIMDYTYTAANVSTYEAILDGFKFDCSAVFPGSVDPPAIVTHTATIDASYPDTLGWLRQGDDLPARKPTGTYVSPGTIVTVTVPSALVNSGYQIRIGAHSWDHTNRNPNKRLARSTVVYDITTTQTKVANPLGGGVYIEVPYLSADGIVTVDVTGAVRSPYFSAKSFHTTTLSEWQNVERNHPAPWADFQTEKYMTQVPTNWIYAYDDPVTSMADWDAGIDTMNDLMGFPRDRGKETVYTQNDVIMRSSVHAPGYPSVNTTDSDPTNGSNGNTGSYLVNGPTYQISSTATEIHEQGHAYFFDKFGGEQEAAVNLLYVPILNVTFAYDLDYAFAASRGMQGNPNRTLDNTAITWMVVFNFSPREVPMAAGEKAYQLKGHAKFVDIARLFGWQVLNDYYYQLVLENKNKNNSGLNDDDRILRWCQAAGLDLRPLFHFWGMHPADPVALANAIAAEGLPKSPEILAALGHYKSIVPADNAAFQAHALAWWGREPSIGGNWTEREHTRQWDTTDYWTSNGWDYCGTDPAQADGEIYTEATHDRIVAVIDGLIDLYFPGSDLEPPTPNPMTWATAPYATGDSSITMVASTASDPGGVEYYFRCTAGGGNDSGWQAGTSYTDAGLSPDTQYTYTVQARDLSPAANTTAPSTAESATTDPDSTPPTPDPMTWAQVPTPGGGGSGGGGTIMSASLTAPIVDGEDIASYGTPTGQDKWWPGEAGDFGNPGKTVGQTFTTGSSAVMLNAFTFQVRDATEPAKDYTIRVGTISGTTFTEIASETATQSFSTTTDNYWTWTLDTPLLLSADTVYGVDAGLNSSTSEWTTGIPYVYYTADVYPDGTRFRSGTAGYGIGDTTMTQVSGDRVFHIDMSLPGSGDPNTSIYMTATVAGDPSGVEYYFDEISGNPGGTDSGWQSSPTYLDTGLTPGTMYTYTVTARDLSAAQNMTAASTAESAYTAGGGDDTDPPVPNPAVFAVAPTADSDTAISMTATTGADATGPVEYYFDETSGNPGGSDSGWQTSPSYTDSGLTAVTQYTYTVQMRDSVTPIPNVGTASSPASATTDPTPDTDPPTPNPATFASPPTADSDTAISMTATTGSDASGPVEYYFDETSGNPGGTDSGWQTSPSYTDTGLSPSTQYTYTVTMRDSAPTPNVGAPSSPANATTGAQDVDDTANADLIVAGTVSGSYTDTQVSDNGYESITEIESGGKPANRYSYLEHKWTVNVTGGETVVFYVEAYQSASSDGDNFVFAYSTNDSSYTDMVTVTKTADDDTYQSYVMPASLSGTVYIRVVDTDQSQGNRNLDTISIDHIFIRSAAPGPPDTDPPTPNPATFAVPPTADSDTAISMTATTGSDASGPVQYYFDETSGNPGGSDSGWQTSPSYTDTGLSPSTQYTYTVQMRDSAPTPNVGTASAPANATTLAGCTPTDIHIEAVVCGEVGCGGPNKNGQATVTIFDNCGNPVANALVDGTFSGDFSETIYDVVTDGNGQAVLTTSGCIKKPTFSFTVIDVTHATLPHDSNDDVTTGCSG